MVGVDVSKQKSNNYTYIPQIISLYILYINLVQLRIAHGFTIFTIYYTRVYSFKKKKKIPMLFI
jgi:hypothetical protein